MLNSSKKIISILLIILILLFLLFYFEVGKYKKYEELTKNYSYKYGIDQNLLLSILKTESNFNPKAVSNKGAIGIAQILPSTAVFIASQLNYNSDYDLFDVKTSIEFASYYLSYLSKKFRYELDVICAYNAGEGRVLKWNKDSRLREKDIPYNETKRYYKKVIRRKNLYRIIR